MTGITRQLFHTILFSFLYFLEEKPENRTYMMKSCCSYVIKVPQQSKQTTPLFVIPNLKNKYILVDLRLIKGSGLH